MTLWVVPSHLWLLCCGVLLWVILLGRNALFPVIFGCFVLGYSGTLHLHVCTLWPPRQTFSGEKVFTGPTGETVRVQGGMQCIDRTWGSIKSLINTAHRSDRRETQNSTSASSLASGAFEQVTGTRSWQLLKCSALWTPHRNACQASALPR
eukprot:5237139-Amphidinium_carterae.1